MRKSKLYGMGLATLLGFPILGLGVLYFVEPHPLDFTFNWTSPMSVILQILIGLLYGVAAGYFSWWVINRSNMKPLKIKYGRLIHDLKLNGWEIVFISFCAGVGEEFFFRGVLQPYWGIVITAIVFVAIHGYLDPRNKQILIYGVIMTGLIIGIGYLHDYVGLISAMTAHFIIDVVLFFKLSRDPSLAFPPAPPEFVYSAPEELEQ